MKKVTFIITIYDNLNNLSDCIDSIESQSGIEKEIYLLSNKYSRKDIENIFFEKKNVHYICAKKGETIGSLRNSSLVLASGDYICFIDSGDYIIGGSVESIIEKLSSSGFKFAVGQTLTYDLLKNKCYEEDNIHFINGKVNYMKNIYEDKDLSNKIYKTDYIREKGVKFADTNNYNDLVFLAKLYSNAKTALDYTLNYNLKRVIINDDSLCSDKELIEIKIKDALYILNSINIKYVDGEFSYQSNKALLDRLLNLSRNYVLNNYIDIDLFKEMQSSLSYIKLDYCELSEREYIILDSLKKGKFNSFVDSIIKESKSSKKRTFASNVFLKLFKRNSQ